MEIILIAAMNEQRVIGKNNDIPWNVPGEQTRFKEITWGHPMIMGRKTYESIGRALPGRRNIIVTRNPCFQAKGCDVALSLSAGLALCRGDDKVFIIGGEQLFRESIPLADTLILTIVQIEVEGDTFFPEFSEKEFPLSRSEQVEGALAYRINTYRRK